VSTLSLPERKRARAVAPDPCLPALDMQSLFDALTDTVFFVKDCEGRYTHCNQTLVRRLGRKHRSELVGRTPAELFPAPLGASYTQQDLRVLAGGAVNDQLEVHLYPNRRHGWCLTQKRPLLRGGEIIGLIGVSRDLGRPDSRHSNFASLQTVREHMLAQLDQRLRVTELAALAGVSVAQFERQFRRVFQISPQQHLIRLRIDRAMELLRGSESIALIAQHCGFSDQSAFSRQFRATVGVSPSEYRAHGF
jgi:AraC-like DNA-binding protein